MSPVVVAYLAYVAIGVALVAWVGSSLRRYGEVFLYDVFVEQMPRVLRCRYITQADLLAGRWSEHVEALLEQPAPPTTSMVNGADVAAQFLLKLVY